MAGFVLGMMVGFVLTIITFGNKMTLIGFKASKDEFIDDRGIDDIGKEFNHDTYQYIVLRMNLRKNTNVGWKQVASLLRQFQWEGVIQNPDFSTIEHNQIRISVRLQIPRGRLKELSLTP